MSEKRQSKQDREIEIAQYTLDGYKDGEQGAFNEFGYKPDPFVDPELETNSERKRYHAKKKAYREGYNMGYKEGTAELEKTRKDDAAAPTRPGAKK